MDPLAFMNEEEAQKKNLFDVPFLRKARCWEYEQEYRIMVESEKSHRQEILPSLVKRVIIGCAMPDDKKGTILRWIHENAKGVSVAYAVPVEFAKYGIRIVEG